MTAAFEFKHKRQRSPNGDRGSHLQSRRLLEETNAAFLHFPREEPMPWKTDTVHSYQISTHVLLGKIGISSRNQLI